MRRRTRPAPQLTPALILKWIKLHCRRKGCWPSVRSGPVIGAPGENWAAINKALREGHRGLAGGSTLARFLAEAGLKQHVQDRPPLTIEGILTWLEADQRATGKWPNLESGPVRAAPGENWAAIHTCLCRGGRGLPGRMTLAGLLRFHRNVLLRARQILPVRDGQRLITTPLELTVVLVTRGPLQQPDLLYSLRERQKKFQREARRAASKR